MEWYDKLQEAKVLFAKIEKIQTEGSDEEKANIAELVKQYQDLKAEALNLKEKEAQLEELRKEAQAMAQLEKDAEVAKQTKQVPQQNGAPKTFKTWGEFLMAAHAYSTGEYKDARLTRFTEETKQSTMVESVGASGGFLVPAEFRAELMAVMGERSLVRGRATVIPMARREVLIPTLDQEGTTSGVPHWFGGMQFYWHEEAQEKTLTEAKFRQIKLVAHKLIGYTRASDELLDDSAISLEAFLGGPMGMAGGIAWMEDWAFINGSGAGQPLGVIPAPATITVAREVQHSVTYTDLTTMVENFLPSGRGVWFISQSCMQELLTLNGPSGNPSYIWANAVNGAPGTLLGMPVIWTEKCPRIGTAGDVILADWSYYLLGDRQATTVESTKFDRWRYDETSWRAVHRVDGQPWLGAPLTYQDGTTQVSPFVILGAKTT